jgi:hypothetical protein
MDRILKLVYSNWYQIRDEKFPIANGLHPEIVKFIQDKILEERLNHSNKDFLRIKEIDTLYYYNNPKSGYFFRNSNFFYHFNKTFGSSNIIDENSFKNDNNVYFYPIELECNTTNFLIGTHKFCLNDVEYQYSFTQCFSPKILDLIKLGKIKLLLVNMIDTCVEPSILKELEKSLNEIGIPSINVVCMYGNIKDADTKFQMIEADISLYQIANEMENYPCITQLGYESDYVRITDLDSRVIRNKKFLSFNRHPRAHRLALCYIIVKNKLLKDGLYSFLFESSINKDLINRITPGFDNKIIKEMEEILPYELDTQHLKMEEKQSFYSVTNNKKDFYINSYIHITSETEFDTNGTPFLSEKTWRPILNLQPFIYIGNYLALNKIRSLGFKTFHPFIDENYDLEKDHKKRFEMIEIEINKFASMPTQEIHNWYYSIIDILIYNQRHLSTFKNFNILKGLQ